MRGSDSEGGQQKKVEERETASRHKEKLGAVGGGGKSDVGERRAGTARQGGVSCLREGEEREQEMIRVIRHKYIITFTLIIYARYT
jgi:hypothetical protein